MDAPRDGCPVRRTSRRRGRMGEGASMVDMVDFFAALGVALILEGAAYALFPDAMRRMISQVLSTPDQVVRAAGLAAALFGLILVWLARGVT